MGKKAPKAPDPVKTAGAQAGLNIDTAVSQQMLNMVNQEGPWGSTTYNPTGYTSYTDSFGKTHQLPTFTQQTTYNPAQQAIFDKTTQAQTNLADLSVQQSGAMKDYLANPFEFNNQDAADWAYDLGASRIVPEQARQEEALRSRLVNSGIRPGTQAWNAEMERQQFTNNDQLNQLALQGRSQAFDEAKVTRDQPINEISALLSGSQIAGPNSGMSGTPQTSVGGVDYAGLVNSNYQQEMNAYNTQMGGLFGMLGTGAQAAMMASDIRVKEDISRVGTLDNGLPVYMYRYKSGGPMQIGVMAQDVEKLNPAAVVEIGGVKHVDYGKAVN